MRTHISSLLIDYYELTMANGYIECNHHKKHCCFEVFFRQHPNEGNYSIFSGIYSLIDAIKNFKFNKTEILYLRKQNKFSDNFIKYLENFNFICDIWAIAEGTPIFPNEPIIKIKGPILQVQLIETIILLNINHQSLIATKASRIVCAANYKPVLEFGARRAQGYSAALYGARSAYIAGCNSTSCVLANQFFNIPLSGTMSHSWIQSFDSEYIAFKKYAEIYLENSSFLIDTYDAVNGLYNAIKVDKEILKPKKISMQSIRIDSGNLLKLSFKLRKILNLNNYNHVKIIASNSLDEFKISTLLNNKAPIDIFGVGENLITSNCSSFFGGVYKLVAIKDENNNWLFKRKNSEDRNKQTIPGIKELYRFYSKINDKIIFDIICLEDENIYSFKKIYNPLTNQTMQINFKNIYFKKILNPLFRHGKNVLTKQKITTIRKYSLQEVNSLNKKYKNLNKKYIFPVYYSIKLQDLINKK